MYANFRGRIYVCSRTMSAKYSLLANEGESIYGHRILLNRAFKFLTLEGSSPVLDDEISKVINQATLVVLMIYDLLAFIAYIGFARIF